MRTLSIPRFMALFLAAAAACAQAHDHEHMGSADAELGSVTFETSCRPQVAGDINRGVALLHSFWHDEALRTFEAAAAADPECAMAWWGQGMALFHLYSSTPSDKELAAGAQALAKADAASEKT